MIPSPAGIIARYMSHNEGPRCYQEKPVLAFDDEGRALVLGKRRLVPADSYGSFTDLRDTGDSCYVALVAPGGWRVEFTSEDGSKWDEPLVGWALKSDGTVDPLSSDSDGLVDNFDNYGGEYRIYHPGKTGTGAPEAEADAMQISPDSRGRRI